VDYDNVRSLKDNKIEESEILDYKTEYQETTDYEN